MRHLTQHCILSMLWYGATLYALWCCPHGKELKMFSHLLFTSAYALWNWPFHGQPSHKISTELIEIGQYFHLVDLMRGRTLSSQKFFKGYTTPSPWWIWCAHLNMTIVTVDWYSSPWILSWGLFSNHVNEYCWNLILGHLTKISK